MARAWLFGFGLVFGACLSIEEARTSGDGGESGGSSGGGNGGSAGTGDGGAGAFPGGSSSGDASLDAPEDVTPDTWDGNPCFPESPPLLDDFGQPDGPLGSAWTGDITAFAVQAGQLRHTKNNLDDRIFHAKKLCATQTVSVRLMKVDPSSGLVGVLFAASSDNNCNLIQVGHSGYQQAIVAQKCVGGKWSDLMSQPWAVYDGDRIEARLTPAGMLTVLVNGVTVDSVNVGVWPASRPGIAVWAGNTQLSLDDFRGG